MAILARVIYDYPLLYVYRGLYNDFLDNFCYLIHSFFFLDILSSSNKSIQMLKYSVTYVYNTAAKKNQTTGRLSIDSKP